MTLFNFIPRFGSFEIFKPMSAETGRKGPSVGRTDILIQMLDYSIKTFYKEVSISCVTIKHLHVMWGIYFSKKHLFCIYMRYHKFPKYSDTQNICCNHSKIWTMWLYHRVMSPNDADGMANSADPDQTALVWSGSALFAQASENLGSLR